MPTPKPRPIPLAAAALSLSFGSACEKSHAPSAPGGAGSPGGGSSSAGSGGTTGNGSGVGAPGGAGDALGAATRAYLESYCDSFARCYPEEFGYYFASDTECVRYYDDYFSYYYIALVEGARDAAACELAILDAFDCYAERYHGGSCGTYYYCDDSAYYAYYDYYGGYYVVGGDPCGCWYIAGAHYACV